MEVKLVEYSTNGSKSIATLLCHYPRIVHAEVLRHRVFSSSVSSSRAKPYKRFVEEAKDSIAYPSRWQLNKPGMQGGEEFSNPAYARMIWEEMAQEAFDNAAILDELKLHKQITNRVIEPFTNVHHLITATEWDNFFSLRVHEDADPTVHELAVKMQETIKGGDPIYLAPGEWHLPFVSQQEREVRLGGKQI